MQELCGLSLIKDNSIILYENNVVCIAQIKGCCYIKGNKIKYILSKFFYILEFQKSGEINV